MKKEPFKYGKPVTGRYFIDRDEELDRLYRSSLKIKSRGEVNVALIGLRRTGKTSLLHNLIERLEEDKKIIPVFLDCYGLPSQNTFSKLMTERVKEAYVEKTKDMGYKERVKSLLKKKTSEILSKTSEMEISISHYLSIRVALQEGEEEIWEDSLKYAEKLGKDKDVFFVIMLDEFPDIAMRWGDNFVKRIRSIVQHQDRCMYIFTGSAVTYMTELAESESSPFYRQLNTIKLEELPSDIAKSFVAERLEIDGEVLETFVNLTGGLPDYIQRLGYILYNRYGEDDISIDKLKETYEKMLDNLEMEFKETLSRFNQKSGVYGDIILSLPHNERISKVAEDINMPLSALSKYMKYLVKVGMVKKVKRGVYILADPVFNDWVERLEEPMIDIEKHS